MRSHKIKTIFSIITLFCSLFSCKPQSKIPDATVLHDMAVKESINPIRPGQPQKTPFWNVNARRFIHVPSFDFTAIDGAATYRFTATAADSQDYIFEAEFPWATLTPIWQQLPVGFVSLKVEALNNQKQIIALAGTRDFYRASVFQGSYFKPVTDYRESARRALKYLFDLEHYQNWIKTGKPDPSYDLYCYPAKIIGAVVESMLLYARLSPADAENALHIAQKAATYLISISEPAGAPLEFFPPTYAGTARTANEYKDQFMLIYPAAVGLIYLDLYDVTNNKDFYNAATRIADTYVKLQLPEGTWRLKILKNGQSVTNNYCIPIAMINLFDRLADQYGLSTYNKNSEQAFRWIMDNPVKTFNWEGQFEDVAASQLYKNLSKHLPCSFAIELFDRYEKNPHYLELATELLRFAEDQFVVWEKPMAMEKWHTEQWITPCALEQYAYYVPIDASAAKLIATFQKAYEVTGDELYLAKAKELANTMTVAQDPDTGRYPTYWERNDRGAKPGWINCATYDAKIMLSFGKFIEGNNKGN